MTTDFFTASKNAANFVYVQLICNSKNDLNYITPMAKIFSIL